MARLLHGELPVHQPAVGVVDRVDQREQVHGLVDPPVLGERGAERDRVAFTPEHPQQVVRPDLVGDERSGDAEHVRPVRGDPLEVHLVAGDGLQRPVPGGRRLTVGQVGPPEPLVGEVAEARGEAEAEHLVQAEGHVGVRRVVGRDHLRLHPAVKVQQRVQRVEAVARGAAYDHRADPRDLVIDGI